MSQQNQYRITLPEESKKLIEARSKKLGLKVGTFCTNIVLEYLRKQEVDKK